VNSAQSRPSPACSRNGKKARAGRTIFKNADFSEEIGHKAISGFLCAPIIFPTVDIRVASFSMRPGDADTTAAGDPTRLYGHTSDS